MNKTLLALGVGFGVALAGMAHAADIIPVIFDDPGEGYNDPTPVAPIGGNPGTTIGQQRTIVANYAADLWGTILVSDVPIYVGAQFNPLAPNVLGSAGSTQAWFNHPNFPYADTLYAAALADALAGEDLQPNSTDISSQFSSTFAFYFGLDNNTPAGQINFLDVVMHEYGHGLGFANFANEQTGRFLADIPDVYSQFTYDNTQLKFWPAMSITERQASAVNDGNVVFTGAATSVGAPLTLVPRMQFRVSAPLAIAGVYGFNTAGFGPAPSPVNFASDSVVVGLDAAIPGTSPTTTDGCSPFTNAAEVAGNYAVVDRGTCGFAVKAKNAQDAGARGVIVANNAPGPAPGLGGGDPAVVIPTISVSQADGAVIKGAAGVVAALEATGTGLQGADDAGRPLLYMPPVVALGSTGSHFDTRLLGNALMEPAINDSLFAAMYIDNSANLLKDTGWKLNTGNAVIAGCDTTIKVIDDSGLIVGANVVATSNLLRETSPDKATYQSRMEAFKDRLVAAGLITGKQGGKMMACSAKTPAFKQ